MTVRADLVYTAPSRSSRIKKAGGQTHNAATGVLQDQGDLAGARPLYERALAIREKVLGAEHPNTAANLNDLASLLQAQGDLTQARSLYERAMAICEKVLGPEHPDAASTMNNLARVLRDTGHANEAETLFHKAIAIGEKSLGRDHPLTQRYSARVTADALDALGRTEEAKALRERYGLTGSEDPEP